MAHLPVDAADVFADQGQSQGVQAHKDKQNSEKGENSLNLRPHEEAAQEQEQAEEQPQESDGHSGKAHRMDGQVGKAGHQVEVEAEQLDQAILGLAPLAFGVAHGNLGHPPGKDIGQGRNEAGGLLALVDRVDHLPAVGPQHATVVPQLDAGDPGHHHVHQVGGQFPEQGILAVLPPAAHGVVTFLDLCHQAGNLFRRVLQVRVQSDHHLAPGRLKAGEDGLVLAEIAVKLQSPEVFRVLIVELGEDFPGAVAGAVIHQDDFKGALHVAESAHQPLSQLPEVLFFVINGDDYGDVGCRRRGFQGQDLVGH